MLNSSKNGRDIQKFRNASIGCLNLTLGARNVIWTFLFRFSFVSSASWLVLGGVMSARCQAAIALSRIVSLCDRWLRCVVPISHIRIIRLHGFFFIWVGSCMRDDCYMSCTHRLLQDNLKLTIHPMFTIPNVFGAWQRHTSQKHHIFPPASVALPSSPHGLNLTTWGGGSPRQCISPSFVQHEPILQSLLLLWAACLKSLNPPLVVVCPHILES